MKDQFEQLLKEHMYDQVNEATTLRYLLRSGFRKDLVVVFRDSNKSPLGIGYLTDEEGIRERLERHHDTLVLIQEKGSDQLKSTVPRPVFLEKCGAHWILFVSSLSGIPMSQFFNSQNKVNKILTSHLPQAMKWLTHLHKEFQQDNQSLQSLVNSSEAKDSLGEIEFEARNATVPMVLQHGDFHPTNLLVNGQQISVVDWEYSAWPGLPLYDVFFLLVHIFRRSTMKQSRLWSLSKAIYQADNNINLPQTNDFKGAFFEENRYSDIFKSTIQDYCFQLDIDPSCAKILFYLFLARYRGKDLMQVMIKDEADFIIK